MRTCFKRINPFVALVAAVYVVLGIATLHNCYFWDVIQQVSKEGYWFYATDFSSLLIPTGNEYGIMATGYHPPLMGLMTAVLWKVFGCELWVSHAFSMLWAGLLLYHVWKLVLRFFPKGQAGWVLSVVLLDAVVLSQFAIASPDFILFTAFVMALRGLLERKPWLQGVGIFFLCCVNMRGVFAGVALFAAGYYYHYAASRERGWQNALKKALCPYWPTLAVLLAYFTYYFVQKGWFFTDSAYTEHYVLPESGLVVVRHLFSFVLRLVENGHVVIWLLAVCCVLQWVKRRDGLTLQERTLAIFFLLLMGVYVLFVFISQMPFSPRYFMPQFFTLSILVCSYLGRHYAGKRLKAIYVVVLLFVLTGHGWIYPEKMAKPWDATLAHLPYYALRQECFGYIEAEGIDYAEVSSGFCLYGDRGFAELQHWGKTVSPALLSGEYVIYSNVCNMSDEAIDTLHNPALWTPLRTFERWPVVITVYQRVHHGDGE